MASWWTFALQAVNFLALVWLLHRFLYRPVQTILAERQQRAEAAAARVTAAEHAQDLARAQIDHDRGLLGSERAGILDAAHAEADVERVALLARARETADEILDSGRKALAEERRRALAELETHAAEIAAAMAARMLGELASASVDDDLLERTDAYLAALPTERLRGLAVEAAAAGVEVVTAHELPPQLLARRRQRLAGRLGEAVRISFRTDPSLVAGAELHFRTAVLRVSWRDALVHAEQQVHAVAG